MSNTLTMDVLMLHEHFNHVAGAPDASAGDIINVPFSVGAHLVAVGYAEPNSEETKPGEPEDFNEVE